MNLKSISDVELRRNKKTLVKKEVLIGIEVLQHLREIEGNRGFTSRRVNQNMLSSTNMCFRLERAAIQAYGPEKMQVFLTK